MFWPICRWPLELKRFILNREPDKDNMVRLDGDDYRYLVRVRRLAEGEFFPALLPSGDEVLVQVLSVGGGILAGKCVASLDATSAMTATDEAGKATQAAALPPIVLFQALPKGEKMDLIVRQAAEGALAEIVPFVSEFSITKIRGDGQKKLSRWERIIKEARQQSGSTIPTAIRPPLTMDSLFAYWEELKAAGSPQSGTLGLLFHHLPLAQASLHSYLDNNPRTVALAVGPEGGFSAAEASRFLEAGFKPLTIGDTILRTETAALYCAAAIRIILLERNSWKMKQVKNSG
jgi:16S rRNA (uracil1498-N3)-methyltransferase